MLADPRRGLMWSGILLAGAALLTCLVWSTAGRDALQHVDDAFLDLVERIRFQPLTAVARAFNFIGGVYVNWPIRILVLVILVMRRYWLHFTAFVLTLATSEACIGPLKSLIDRPRPPGGLVGTSGASFPSGHAVAAAVTAVGLVIVLLPPGHTRWVWERRAALYASLMALSRTYLGAHWLSDVVAGALIGSGLAIGWPALLVWARVRVDARRRPSPA
jgi:membrane-associated phospholipid phosphatase